MSASLDDVLKRFGKTYYVFLAGNIPIQICQKSPMKKLL